MSNASRQRKKQKQRQCRIVIEHLTKFINLLSVCVIAYVCYKYQVDPYIGFVFITVVWMYLPDVIAYILETVFNCPHNIDTYR